MVRNGKPETMYYNTDMGGARQRTAIGLFADGRIWLYCDKTGKTPEQLRQIALDAGVDSALMLDGGGSTQGNISRRPTVTSSRLP
jgi:exopolysaccharide biosynthesis protein